MIDNDVQHAPRKLNFPVMIQHFFLITFLEQSYEIYDRNRFSLFFVIAVRSSQFNGDWWRFGSEMLFFFNAPFTHVINANRFYCHAREFISKHILYELNGCYIRHRVKYFKYFRRPLLIFLTIHIYNKHTIYDQTVRRLCEIRNALRNFIVFHITKNDTITIYGESKRAHTVECRKKL